jgi:hypothetical protein
MFLENDLSQVISLNGEWQFQLADQQPRAIQVPSAWEASTDDKLTEGLGVYRRSFPLPPHLVAGEGRCFLECDAVSFAATVRVNGHLAGEHTGLWTRWQLDITPFVRDGENEIEIEVWKPGEGRYKLRESLAGFLPDVCNTFGGIWQGIRLRCIQGAAIADLRVQAEVKGVARVTGRVVGSIETRGRASLQVGAVHIQEIGVSAVSAPIKVKCNGTFKATLRLRGHQIWSPQTPQTYGLKVEVAGASVTRRIGFRDVRAEGDTTLLNGAPIHFRGVLDWGWDERRLCPTPSRDEVRDAFAKARSLGFNLFKLCLFVPDETMFEAANEEGMLLWLELPMWLPRVTDAFKLLALREYEGILQRVHHHSSVVVVSLGCELDAQADAEFLAQLRALVKRYLPNALLCDNSGSSEAYGGATHVGDFYDYHFYADLHYFQPLVEHFSRAYQPDKPWIYGEFCDADTMRDWSALRPKPFWVTGPVTMQRDELTWAREHETRLRAADITDGGAEVTRLGRQQATVMRKFVFEQMRKQRATGGYVVTGWRDTPIATSGVVDDRGELKFDPGEWRLFNADRVLVMDRERRRKWRHGGDRPVYRDPCTWWSDEPIEVHVALSNGGATVTGATLMWQLCYQNGVIVAQGLRDALKVNAGVVEELLVLVQQVAVREFTQLELSVQLVVGDALVAHNIWPLWVVPALDVAELLLSPALFWLDVIDLRFCFPQPFWREAIHVNMFLNQNAYANVSWYGIATDTTLDADRLATTLGVRPNAIRPRWRRFDARAMTWSDYVVDVRLGRGLLRLTTLRCAGGLGHQPNSLETNPMGAWWLSQLLQFD